MLGDIIQDHNDGWFYRDNGDGTLDNLSALGGSGPDTAEKTTLDNLHTPVVLVRDGRPTGDGDDLASRIAVRMARRYA